MAQFMVDIFIEKITFTIIYMAGIDRDSGLMLIEGLICIIFYFICSNSTNPFVNSE
jgi:hypothetical protein